MKHLLILSLLICCCITTTFAQTKKDSGLRIEQDTIILEDHNNEKDGTSVSLWIPGLVFKAASLFVDKQEEPEVKKLLVKLRSVRVLVKDGDFYAPRFERKYNRLAKRMKRRNFEPLILVNTGEEKVNLTIKTNKRNNKIKQVAVVVNSEDSFVLVKAKGKINPQNLLKMTQEYKKGEGISL